MKTYRVTVEGETYEVTIEEVTGGAPRVMPPRPAAPTPPPPAAKPVAPPKPATSPQPTPPPAPKPTSGIGGKGIQAPMPGKIVAVNVTPGAVVKSGTVLLILEAMKMENDIMASADGTVKAVHAKVGDSVSTGDVLVEFE